MARNRCWLIRAVVETGIYAATEDEAKDIAAYGALYDDFRAFIINDEVEITPMTRLPDGWVSDCKLWGDEGETTVGERLQEQEQQEEPQA